MRYYDHVYLRQKVSWNERQVLKNVIRGNETVGRCTFCPRDSKRVNVIAIAAKYLVFNGCCFKFKRT